MVVQLGSSGCVSRLFEVRMFVDVESSVFVRVRVGVMVMVRVISLRDSFSVLLRPQRHSMLTTSGRVHTSLW